MSRDLCGRDRILREEKGAACKQGQQPRSAISVDIGENQRHYIIGGAYLKGSTCKRRWITSRRWRWTHGLMGVFAIEVGQT